MTNAQKKRKTVPLLDLDMDNNRVVKLEAHGEELIPGIPNEITMNHVLTKQHWRDFRILSSVNRSWLQFEVTRDERFYDVPPIPQVGEIPACSVCVSLDGKLYVLGGVKNDRTPCSSDEVYVLDLAGQRGWRRCASMPRPRPSFGCDIMNGKIYACGGHPYLQGMVPEVYDPEVDAWSSLPSMLSWRFNPRLKAFREQLIVQGGGNASCPHSEGFVEVYNSIEEKWQFVGLGSKFWAKDLRFARERIYSITWSDIRVQEGQNRWTHLHSLTSEPSVKSLDAYTCTPFVPVVVDNELLTLLFWAESPRHCYSYSSLVRTRGFCSGKKEIVWEDASWSRSEKLDGLPMSTIMCTIRL